MSIDADTTLAAIQARLSRLITAPEGVSAALAAGGDPFGRGLDTLVRSDRGLAPTERVSVYAGAWFARLHDSLRDDFGALAVTLGAEAFHDLVSTYLMMFPPTRPSLRHAGADLALHLKIEPFASIFARRCPYAADLARLEWSLSEVFFAEDAMPLTPSDFAGIDPETLMHLRFRVAPAVALLDVGWPVHRIRERFDAGTLDTDGADDSPRAALAAARTRLRVWRQGERVRYRAIDACESAALEAARAGEPFADLCARVTVTTGEAEAPNRMVALLSTWLADEILVRVD